MIDRCTFGTMTIAGRLYTSDLLILPDGRVVDEWWRAAGHHLAIEDIAPLIESGPDLLVLGTGINARVRIDADVNAALARQGIELVAEPTETAARAFNSAWEAKRKVAAGFHLTC